jgi:hypothetical protein
VTSKSIEKDDESFENYSLKSQAEVSKPFASNFRQVGVIKPFSRDRSYHPFVGSSSTNQLVTSSSSASASVLVSKEKRKEEKKVVISRNKDKEEEKPISLSPIKNEEKEKKLNEIVDTDKSLFPVASSTKLEEKSFENIHQQGSCSSTDPRKVRRIEPSRCQTETRVNNNCSNNNDDDDDTTTILERRQNRHEKRRNEKRRNEKRRK